MKRGQPRGFPVGKPGKHQIKYSVGLNPQTWDELCALARARKHTVAHTIRLLVEYALEEQENVGWLSAEEKRPWELVGTEVTYLRKRPARNVFANSIPEAATQASTKLPDR